MIQLGAFSWEKGCVMKVTKDWKCQLVKAFTKISLPYTCLPQKFVQWNLLISYLEYSMYLWTEAATKRCS